MSKLYIEDTLISFNYIKKEDYKGSYQGMRYMLAKREEQLIAYVWPEPFCFEATKDEEKITKEFAMTLEGKSEAVKWLNEKYEEEQEKWTTAKNNAFHW